ncbi:MAG: HAMP domain-containing sensor histidine kinase [Chitinophagaceae bacterium]
MKLFSRYNRLNLLATLLIFLLATIAYYFLLRYVIISQVDENLNIEKDEIESYVAKYNLLPEIMPVEDQQISFIASEITYKKKFFKTVIVYDRIEKETGEFRRLYFTFSVNGKWHLAIVGKSMESSEDLIQSIVIITVCTILLILVASILINRIVLNKLWLPFYKSLHLLKNFKIGNSQAFNFPISNIEEFSFMNNVLREAMVKADRDYLILKEFTENASHETQTPLAIIRSKLDLLIQDENLSKHQGVNLQALYEAIQKLSRLNSSLLLLTKIENNQFKETVEINLKDEIEEKLVQFQEILLNKNLRISVSLDEVIIRMNKELVDILLNNLLSNAIKHNMDGGSINICLSKPQQLMISNTGSTNALDTQRIFTRFYKSQPGNEHTGLGLSILKQICIVSNCTIRYDFKNDIHTFDIEW